MGLTQSKRSSRNSVKDEDSVRFADRANNGAALHVWFKYFGRPFSVLKSVKSF